MGRGTPRRVALALVGALVLAACANAPTDPDGAGAGDAPQRYEADGTVLESADHGPELCLGGIADSLPPQCKGVPIAGWNWALADGEESASGTTWGTYHLVGTYDGTSFTVQEIGAFEAPAPDSPDFTPPCPEPDGGWVAPDPDLATEEDRIAAVQAAEAEDDSAGVWIDYVGEPSEGPVPPGGIVLVAAFTGDLERHEAELRELWGGPLCVTQHERTQAELHRIQEELGGHVGAELGLAVTHSWVDVVDNVVGLGVVVADEAMRLAIAERYGASAVRLVPALTPVSGI